MNSESGIQNTEKIFFDNVAILGVGLIGASLAFALREKGLCTSITGYGRNENNLRRAREKGIIDGYTLDAASACKEAGLVVISTPVGSFEGIVSGIRASLQKGAVVTDVGSVKGALVRSMEELMPEAVHYIGSHPIAGSDRTGIDDARSGLFKDALCIITPTENSNKTAVEKIRAMWSAIGARVKSIDPFEHDRIYAAVSHLPHVLAYALVNTLNDFNADYIGFAGQGFRDTTRIALSSPELWRDISIYNRDNIIELTAILRKNIDAMEKMLTSKDAQGLEREFFRARELRKKLA